MGVIRRIFFVVTVFFVCSVSAQTSSDTIVFDGEKYVKHIVQAGESLKLIALLHKVTTADIIENNEIYKRLYYNQLLYIPIYGNQEKSKRKNVHLSIQKQIELAAEKDKNNHLDIQKELELTIRKDTSRLNIALLMPYFLVKNKGLKTYKGSDISLSFHIGVELALDSLRKQGKNICLHTFDTNKDTLTVKQIIRSKVLDNMDIIIGPLYASNFRILCKKYGNDTTKVLISPLSKYTDALAKKCRAVYQLSPSVHMQIDVIKEYVSEHHKEDRVIILNKRIHKEELLYIKNLFRKDGKVVEIFPIELTHINTVRNIFKENQVVIIPSEDQAFVSKLLSSIGRLKSTSLVFGLSEWKKYDNLNIDNLMSLDVTFPNIYNFQLGSDHNNAFVRLFEQKYKTNPVKYTQIAYNIMMDFCSET